MGDFVCKKVVVIIRRVPRSGMPPDMGLWGHEDPWLG